MDAREALRLVREAGRTGVFWVGHHARQRMAERNVRVSDIEHGLSIARSCSSQRNDRWKVPTEDLDGDELTLIIELRDGFVVVTVF
jgi:hypothetical protein